MTAVAPPAGSLTFKTLADRLEGHQQTLLRSALAEEVAAGRVRLERGRYRLVRDAFTDDVLLALLAFGEEPPNPDPADEASADPLPDDLAAVLTVEPFGLSCDQLARAVRRRRADVLATLRRDPRFAHQGGRRGSRWRLRPPEGPRDGRGRVLQPPVGLALGQLALARLRAAEDELAALRTTRPGGEVAPGA
jgi:hypothetical protein